MKDLQGIRRHVLYGTLTQNTFREIIPLLIRENNDTMGGLTIITLSFGGVLSLVSLFGALSRRPLPAYLFLLLSSAGLILFRRLVPHRDRKVPSFVTCYLQCAALLTFGMLNSSAFSPDPESNGTIFVVMLLVVPFLMIDVPYRMGPFLMLYTALYCILIRIYKAPKVISLDTTNTVAVCLVSCMCNWVFASKNMQSLANRLYIQKERDSDALTGLLTKQSARILTDAHLAAGGWGSYFIIDLDNFKQVNDTYGHLYGDEVLTKVSSCIKENTRRSDVAARFGGDEFTIFFPELDPGAAEAKVTAFFKSLRFSFAGEPIQVTCSVGITQALPFEDYDVLFEQADKALYCSKEQGKDRFTIYQSTF